MSKVILIIVLIVIITGLVYYFGFSQKTPAEQKEEAIEPVKELENKPLKIEILKEGTGQAAKSGDTVTVHYTGTLQNGVKFDSSLDRQTPFIFTLGAGQVIPGWEQGILGMKVGEKRKLTIAPELAYGSAGVGAVIPPNATLIFEVDRVEK